MDRITLEQLCTIEDVRTLRDSLIAAIDAGGSLEVDASNVQQADIAALQLLVSARKECEARGAGFTLIAGDAVSRLAARAGLTITAA